MEHADETDEATVVERVDAPQRLREGPREPGLQRHLSWTNAGQAEEGVPSSEANSGNPPGEGRHAEHLRPLHPRMWHPLHQNLPRSELPIWASCWALGLA